MPEATCKVMHKLYLVRHALTRQDRSRNMAAWELDPAGLPLLEQMAALLHWSGAYRVVSSSEHKALATAEAIVRRHGLPAAEPMDALREIHKTGWVGNHDEVMARVFAHPETPSVEGWETAAQALERFVPAAEQVVREAGERDVILVSHATVLSLYLARLNGQSHVNPADWRAVGMPDYAVVDTATMRVVKPFGAWVPRGA